MSEDHRDELPWRLDQETKKIVSVDGRPLDQAFWLSRPVEERWMAVEVLRRAEYGEAATGRMRRVLEIVTVDWK